MKPRFLYFYSHKLTFLSVLGSVLSTKFSENISIQFNEHWIVLLLYVLNVYFSIENADTEEKTNFQFKIKTTLFEYVIAKQKSDNFAPVLHRVFF